MLRVGLTGGIGSGKSTLAQRFSELGALVIDADRIAREVLQPGTEGLAAVVERFGATVLTVGGDLDRQALGAIVFADPAARADLESITHPLIARQTGELLRAAPPDGIVVHDVPLLVEKKMGAGYHLVVVVEADEATRLARLVAERGMPEEEARARMRAQASEEERRAAADVLLDNRGTREEQVAGVDQLWHQRLVPFAANLAHGIPAARPEELVLSGPDPSWPAQARRVLDRLRLAFGATAITADHVGSTAVPGMSAKDVVDLQVGVRSLADADGATLLSQVAQAGFPRLRGAWSEVDRGSGREWPKRMHGGCDPGRIVHVHVREVGDPGWRWALLFRDWLRADQLARDDYAAMKRSLAHRLTTTTEFAQAKEPWFEAATARAEAWAVESGWRPSPH